MRKRRKNRGIITVFVTLIMVPVVTCTGTMVDVARLKLYSSQAAMAADSYGEVVLSEYDNLLKELYGLFSVTQNKEGLEAIENLAKYTKYSFIPDGDNEDLDGFMPYKEAEIDVSYTKVAGASLSNNNVLMTQISDFMKFRVIEELLTEADILGTLGKFDSMSSDMDAADERAEITKSSAKVLGKIDEYYAILKCINDYPGYLTERSNKYSSYSKLLKEVYDSDKYKAYINYLDNRRKIDDAIELLRSIEEAEQKVREQEEAKKKAEEAGEEFEAKEIKVPQVTEAERKQAEELAKQYVDVGAYKQELRNKFSGWADSLDATSQKIKFGQVKGKVKDLDKVAKDLEDVLNTLEEQIESLKGTLQTCSKDLREGITQEIAGLEEITKIADEFKKTVNLLYTNKDPEKDSDNEDKWDVKTDALKKVEDNLLDGDQRKYDWDAKISFEWYDFQDDKSDFYSQLVKLCEKSDTNANGDKKAADKKIENAEKVEAEAKKSLQGDESTEARDITSTLAGQLKKPASSAEVPDVSDCFSGGASLASLGNGAVGKFLLTTYNFGMFSSRVSGIEKPEEDEEESGNNVTEVVSSETDNGGQDEEYYDVSLTKVKMSKDVNYLYGAELEYLIGGYNKSKDNLNYTRNIICGIRMTTNFISTYSVEEVNKAINSIANAAAEAVAATGVGAAAAPLVRVAVSGALRMTVATLETVADWDDLKERKDVVFCKRQLGDMTAISSIASFLGISLPEGEESDDIKLSYEDYMYVIMCLIVDEDDLLDRTSNLITLNVNQSQNDKDTLGTLDFKMANTVTAIKSTCEVNLKFVIVPENFINLFISGTDTSAVIQKLDNGSYGYSVIRGY
ncbi:MAG: hypothetical protein IJZ34_07985 [Lachnospiraceae bacterium]|nr:hypothetical protein [Lachnospiraceae bacterium]